MDNEKSYIKFCLDDYVIYRDEREKSIFCANSFPLNTCYEGDSLEIDLDDTRREKYYGKNFAGDSVRIASSTSMSLIRAQEQNSYLQSEKTSLQVRNSSLETENSNL